MCWGSLHLICYLMSQIVLSLSNIVLFIVRKCVDRSESFSLISSLLFVLFYVLLCYNCSSRIFLTSISKLFNSLYLSCTFQSKVSCLSCWPLLFLAQVSLLYCFQWGPLPLPLLLLLLCQTQGLCYGLCHALIGCNFFSICFCLLKPGLPSLNLLIFYFCFFTSACDMSFTSDMM